MGPHFAYSNVAHTWISIIFIDRLLRRPASIDDIWNLSIMEYNQLKSQSAVITWPHFLVLCTKIPCTVGEIQFERKCLWDDLCWLYLLQVYLADYGLSYRYCPNGEHKEYKENPKKGHNGTIEYTSIDAHKGVGNVKSVIYLILLNHAEVSPR